MESLALADTGFLLFLMCGKSYALVSLVSREAGSYWQQRNLVIVLGSHLGFIITSTAVTALIAIERCVCVVSPFKAKTFLKTRYIAIVILTMGIYALVVKNTALGLKYLTVKVQDPATNTTIFISRLTPFYLRHKTIIDTIYSDLLSVTVPTLSLVVVIVCTSVTVVKLKLSLQWRQKSNASSTVIVTSAEKREAAVTRMLVTVCCLYVICMTPSVMRTFALHRLPGFLISGYLCNTFKVTTALVHLLEVINASANFFIYLKQSSRYKATLFQMCSKFRCLRDTGKKSDAEMSVVSRSVVNSRASNIDCRQHLGQSKGPYNLDTEAGHM
ncbi:probable G-protein coupled receptor AH9.1 [Littorina saxatilis]|uniref:probable G-protein coupled receptor AH9.1 n=1 Tax=Littorina saxatilis TaxID=31220 RepID=UPI0038B4D1C0